MISLLDDKTSTELSEQLCAIFINARQEISILTNQAPENIVESVHLIRKRLKFLRAFVKLTQFCSEGNQYKEINILLRDCGRLISDCRDAHVRAQLLDEFKKAETTRSYTSVIKKLTTQNNSQTREIENELLSGTSVFDELMSNLSKEEIVDYFASLEADAESLFSGYSICYQKSYNAFHSELTNHKADLLHEWRKRTKDLQHQQEILVKSIPADLPPSLTEVSQLCEILGRINDLYMFSDWIKQSKKSVANSEKTSAFLDDIQHELDSVQNKTDEYGHSLYRLSPEEYSDRHQKAVYI